MSCGIISLKVLRNNIYHSQPKFVRHLKSDNIKSRRNGCCHVCKRNEKWFSKNGTKQTDVNKDGVSLCNYTMTNATYAKKPFNHKIIREVLSFTTLHFNVKLDLNRLDIEWHKYEYLCKTFDKSITAKYNDQLRSAYPF